MDKPLIQLTNYLPHPENPEYAVFMFYQEDMAEFFESKLIEGNIKFEKDKDELNKRPRILYAIRRTRLDEAIRYNFEAHGRYRKPFMKNKGIAWFVVIVFLALIGFLLFAHFTNS